MSRRWMILLVLTLARVTMGFQFQSLAALGPVLTTEIAISYTALGALIGIYLLPGTFLAIPSGWLGKRFGDKRLVLIGLTMMTAGGALLAVVPVYEVMLAGRLISGVGAVLLNVLSTKMVTDWFTGHRIVTAMGILISSWPLGIAIALLATGPLVDAMGSTHAFAAPVFVCAVALLLVAMIYTSPPATSVENARPGSGVVGGLSHPELRGVLLAGCVWCFYNIAFIVPLSFGPEFLTSQGTGLAAAGAIVSLTSWLIIPALPLGGWFAEFLGRPAATMAVSFVAIAIVLCAIPWSTSHSFLFAILGLMFGPAGGLIMSLPAQVLREQNRAVGMGVFFTVYYAGMGIFPAIAGYIRDMSGNSATPFWFAAFMIFLALLSLLAFLLIPKYRQT